MPIFCILLDKEAKMIPLFKKIVAMYIVQDHELNEFLGWQEP